MRVPIYQDGKPANLPAAILDTEYWLRWLRSRINEQRPPVELNEYRVRMRPELIEKLRSAIQALTEFLPDEEPRPELRPEALEACPELYRRGFIEGLPPEITEGLENPTLTPVQQAKFNLIKEKLRARQQAARATE